MDKRIWSAKFRSPDLLSLVEKQTDLISQKWNAHQHGGIPHPSYPPGSPGFGAILSGHSVGYAKSNVRPSELAKAVRFKYPDWNRPESGVLAVWGCEKGEKALREDFSSRYPEMKKDASYCYHRFDVPVHGTYHDETWKSSFAVNVLLVVDAPKDEVMSRVAFLDEGTKEAEAQVAAAVKKVAQDAFRDAVMESLKSGLSIEDIGLILKEMVVFSVQES